MNRKKIIANAKRVTNEIHKAKLGIAKDIAVLLDERQMTQMDAAFIMNDAPSQVSLVCTGKLRGFSLERLVRMRAMLGSKVRLVVSNDTSVPEVSYVN